MAKHGVPWLTSKCEVCGMPFDYPDTGLYIPATCKKPECVRAAIHKDLIKTTDGRLLYANSKITARS